MALFSLDTNNKWSNNKKIMIIKYESIGKHLNFIYGYKTKNEMVCRLKCTQRRRWHEILCGVFACVSPRKMRRQSIIINFTSKSNPVLSQKCYVNFNVLINIAFGIFCARIICGICILLVCVLYCSPQRQSG